MKTLASVLIASSLLFIGCGDSKKEETKKPVKVKTEKVQPKKAVVAGDNSTEGKKLFGSKGCTACHHETTKIIGPAVNVIASIYTEKSGDIFKFLKGETEAIVDTDPAQVSIMKNNVDTMLKGISDADLKNIVAYMQSVK